MRRPIGAIAGIRRTVSGNKEVAKCVASSATEAVAWSIESASPVRWYGLITSNSPRSRLILQAVTSPCGGTEASCREKGTRFTAKSLAVARLHPLKAAILRRSFPSDHAYKQTRDRLVERGAIVCDNRYVVGEKSFGFQLGPELIGMRQHKVVVTDMRLANKIRDNWEEWVK